MRAFRSEWIKLSRRTTLAGFGGAMVGFAALITVLMFLNAGGTSVDPGGGRTASFATAETLSLADGSVIPITHVATFLGIIALALFASNLAGEFTRGTIRMLFVTEPRRIKILAGKLAALANFTAAWVAVGLGVSVGLGVLLPSGAGVDTTAWWTADGFSAMAGTYLSVGGSVIVFGLIGAALAVLTRSAAIAISAGAADFMLVEPLVGSFWEALGEWGSSAVSSALAGGGTAVIGYSTAVVMVAAYGLLDRPIGNASLHPERIPASPLGHTTR